MEKKLTRAEQRSLEKYPVNMAPLNYQDLIEQFGGKTEIDVNTYPRHLFQEGFEQAEKDLALTWQDMAKIDAIILDVNNEFAVDYSKEINRQKFYEEVLRRFKETKDGQVHQATKE